MKDDWLDVFRIVFRVFLPRILNRHPLPPLTRQGRFKKVTDEILDSIGV
jgi:hypothetical protein